MDLLSLPHPIGLPRIATITASPPELPPQVRPVSSGWVVVPQIGFEHSNDNSVFPLTPFSCYNRRLDKGELKGYGRTCGMFVLQNMIPPASRYSLTIYIISPKQPTLRCKDAPHFPDLCFQQV